jgi:hypothetical protein
MAITNLWHRVNHIPFSTKARILTIALGVTPIFAIGTINYVQIRHTIEQQTTDTQTERAQSIADKLNRFMFERNGDIGIVSGLPIFVDSQVSQLYSPERKAQILDRFVTSYEVYDSIAAFDLKGDLIAQSKGGRLGNHANRIYFQTALKTGKTFISPPEISQSTGEFAIHIAAPIRENSTGKTIGVMRMRAPVERLERVLQDFATKSQDYHILDRSTGQIFISSDNSYTGETEHPDFITAREKGKLVRHEHYRERTSQKMKMELVSAAPLQRIEGMAELPWTAFSVIDEKVAYAQIQGMLWTMLAGVGFTSALTVGLSSFFADRLTKYIQRVTKTILDSSGEIVDTVQQQEININEQANSAISTTGTVNQLGSFSFQAAEQADASAVGARQALALAEEGTRAVQETLTGMADLREKVDAIAVQIANLSEQTGQISNVSEIVADLAYQTNMLALKAAVEAARAGEQGKGFGVVAGEIRKLADRSKKSAEKINLLSTDIQTEINRTVMVTEEGTKTVQAGIELAQTTSATFLGVTNAVNNLFLNSQQISESSKQQAVAIQQVLNAMNSIAQGSQETAVGMFRVKASTRDLNQIADELQAVLN